MLTFRAMEPLQQVFCVPYMLSKGCGSLPKAGLIEVKDVCGTSVKVLHTSEH